MKPVTPESEEASLHNFKKIYEDHYRLVAKTVRGFRFSPDEADDAIQETFFLAWQNLSSLKEQSAIKSWLVTIARNHCIKVLKKVKPTVAVSTTGHSNEDDLEIELIADDLHTSLHYEHSLSLLRRLIQEHKGEPRATIAKYFYLDGLSVSSIAEKTQIKQNTILSHLRRFRLLVANAMIDCHEAHALDFRSVQ